MPVYDFNADCHKYKDLHDETGGTLKNMHFQYFDCFCGGADFELVSTTTRHRNAFNTVCCLKCGTLRINPYMTEESVAMYYKEVYGRVKRKNIKPDQLYEAQSKKKSALFDRLANSVTQNGKVLDYGSGPGGRLDEFLQKGYKELYLFDYDEHYLTYGLNKGYKRHDEQNKYQLIVLSHVIEHLNDPVSVLQELAGLLEEGGHIYIEAPLYENTRHILGDIHLAHKFYFTDPSLVLAANMAGLKEVGSFKNATLVTLGEIDLDKFSSSEAMALWAQRKAKAKRRERLRKPILFLKNLFQ